MRLATTTVGDGPGRMALVHGLTGDSGTWFELAPWIAERGYTVTLVDQRGHGRSPRAASYAPGEFADDLVETLPRGLDAVVGHSLGGRSLLLAVDRLLPRRAIYLDPGWDIPEDLVLELPRRADGSLAGVEELTALLPGRSRAHVEQAARALAAFDPLAITAPHVPLLSLTPPENPVVPSLVVVPEPSDVVSPGLQARLLSGGYAVRCLPGAGHDLHVVNLQETQRAVEDWL